MSGIFGLIVLGHFVFVKIFLSLCVKNKMNFPLIVTEFFVFTNQDANNHKSVRRCFMLLCLYG